MPGREYAAKRPAPVSLTRVPTDEKQRRLTLAALHFLKKYRLLEERCRFDVVAIVWPDEKGPPQIDHIRDAFEAVGRGQMFR